MAAMAWTNHPLGAPQTWPAALQTNLATLLYAQHPMVLYWGPQLLQFANDAYLQLPHQPLKLEDIGQAADLVPTGATPVFGEDGCTVAQLLHCNQQNSQARAQQEAAQILARMTDAFCMIDRNWTIVNVNSQHVAVTQIPRDEQLGRDFFQVFFPQARREDVPYYHKYKQVMESQKPLSFLEYYAPLKLWTDCQVYPTPDGGVAVFFRDVSLMKETTDNLAREKQKLEAIFAGSPTAMALLQGEELIVERSNAQYTQLVGERALVGRRLEDVLVELKGQPYFGLLREVLATGKPYVAQEKLVSLIVSRGGAPEERYLDFTYSRINDSEGAPYGVYIHAKDVTEKVRSRLSLVEALRARDELLSICSHELKTPVASMKLSTQTFKRGLLRKDPKTTSPERIARMVDQSDRQLDRLTRLIEEMLDFSRISAGRLKLEPAACDLAVIVEETLERLKPQLDAGGTQATLHAHCLAQGRWDSFRLEQLFTNLVTNALKYGEGKPIHVALQQRSDAVILKVTDQGPGICVKDQERIFMPYERAVSVTSISGLGLGLYISRQIAEAHGGSIAVQSSPGAGATFVVHLPKAPPPSSGRKEPR